MKKLVVIAAMAVALLAGAGRVNAQRPVGDTLTNFRDDTTYYIGGYEWSLIPDPNEWFVMTVNNDLHTLGHHRPRGCWSFYAGDYCFE